MAVYVTSYLISLVFLFFARNHALKCDKNHVKPSKWILFLLGFLAFLPFFIISAIRYDVGTDYLFRYVSDYKYLVETGSTPKQEQFYINLYHFIIDFNIPFQLFFVVTSLFMYGFVFFAIMQDKRREYPLLLSIYFLHCIFFSSLSNIRSFLGTSCAMVAFSLLMNWDRKKPVTYIVSLIFVLLSVLFHSSALIYIPFYLFFVFKPRGRFWTYAALILAVVLVPGTKYIVDFLNKYGYAYFLTATIDYGKGRIQLFFILPEMISFVVAVYLSLVKKNDDYHLTYPIVIGAVTIGVYFAAFWVKSNELFLRLYHLFNMFYMFYIPHLLASLNTTSKKLLIGENGEEVASFNNKRILKRDDLLEGKRVYLYKHVSYVASDTLSFRDVFITIKNPSIVVSYISRKWYHLIKFGLILLGLAMLYVQEVYAPLYGVLPYQMYTGQSFL